MANLGFTINQADLPQDTGGDFAPIPAGEYTVRVSEASLETTKTGTGKYIKMRLDVVAPSHEGRVIFTNLNIQNPNPKAEEIGRQQLGSVMRAMNIPAVTDTDQLIGGMMIVKVTVKQDEQYGPNNEVKAFKPAGSASAMPAMGATAPAQTQAPAQSAAGAPPWMQK